jgi:hypothetical protein
MRFDILIIQSGVQSLRPRRDVFAALGAHLVAIVLQTLTDPALSFHTWTQTLAIRFAGRAPCGFEVGIRCRRNRRS